MKERMDKKGEADPIKVIIGIVIVGLLAIFLILFFTGFFETIEEGRRTFTPEQIDLKVLACEGFVSTGASASFCKYQETDKLSYMNCDYSEIKTRLKQEGASGSEFNCQNPKSFCEDVRDGKETGITFNEKMTVNRLPCYKEGGTEGTDHWGVKKAETEGTASSTSKDG